MRIKIRHHHAFSEIVNRACAAIDGKGIHSITARRIQQRAASHDRHLDAGPPGPTDRFDQPGFRRGRFPRDRDTLADINRYNGAALKQISVAAHTLIVCDAAPDAVKPWALLHDAHEARIGDITTRCKWRSARSRGRIIRGL